MKKLQVILASLAVMFGVFAMPTVVSAQGSAEKIKEAVGQINDGEETSLQDQIKTIVNVMLFILGAIAVIMIIIGGFRYVTSNGDQAGVKAGKDIVLYAVVGLVVAILAYAIVNFVLDAFSTNGGS